MSGNKTQTSTSSQQTTPVNPQAVQSILNTIQGVASTPYTPYTGELTAPVNSQQTAGINTINQAAGQAQPAISQAEGMVSGAANPLTQQQISQYENPYTQQVVNATQAQFNEQNAEQQNSLKGSAAAAGALGGDRQAVAQAQLAGQQQLAQAPVIANLESQGYNQAVQTAQQQFQQNPLAAASELGNLGVAGQTAGIQGGQAQMGAGAVQQQTQQNQDTAQYQQYLQQMGFPFQEAAFLAQYGLPAALAQGQNSYGTQTSPGPNLFSQLGGLGLAGAGLFLKDGGEVPARFATGGMPYGGSGMPYSGGNGYIPSTSPPSAKLQVPQLQFAKPSQDNGGLSGITSGLKGLKGKLGGASFGGGNIFSDDAWGGSSSNPLPGLDASDYGAGFKRGGFIDAVNEIRHAVRRSRGGEVSIDMPFAGYTNGGVPHFADGGADDDLPLIPDAAPGDDLPANADVALPPSMAGDGAPTVNVAQNDSNADSWMNFLERPRDQGGLGLAHHQAAGVVGNLMNEATPDITPWGVTGDHGTAEGAGQWRGDRLDALKKAFPDTYQTTEAQQQFMRQEMDGPENRAYRALLQARTPAEAAAAVNHLYERSADTSGRRAAAAEAIANGDDPVAAIDSASGRGGGLPSDALGYAGGAGRSPLTSGSPSSGASEPTEGHFGFGTSPLGLSDRTREALFSAGLGMLSSKSPFFGVALGEGGLKGLSTWTDLGKQAQEAADKRQAEQDKQATRQQEQQRIDLEAKRLAESSAQFAKTNALAVRRQDFAEDKTPTGYEKNPDYGKVEGAKEYRPISGGPADPDQLKAIAAAKQASPTLDDDTLHQMAQQYLAGDQRVFTNLGRGVQGAANVVALRKVVAQEAAAQGVDPTGVVNRFNEQAGRVAAQRVAAQREANIAIAANEARNMIPTALKAYDELDPSDFMPWNQLVQRAQRAGSSPKLAAAVAATTSLVNAYVRAISPTGVPTDQSRQHAYDMLNTAQGKAAYHAVVQTMQTEIDNALRAPSAVRNELAIGHDAQRNAGPSAAAPAAPQPGPRVRQNGHTFERQPDGSYKAID